MIASVIDPELGMVFARKRPWGVGMEQISTRHNGPWILVRAPELAPPRPDRPAPGQALGLQRGPIAGDSRDANLAPGDAA